MKRENLLFQIPILHVYLQRRGGLASWRHRQQRPAIPKADPCSCRRQPGLRDHPRRTAGAMAFREVEAKMPAPLWQALLSLLPEEAANADYNQFRHPVQCYAATPCNKMLPLSATLWCAVKGTDPQREINPPGNWFVPPGSNRSNGGGNEVVGAFGVEGRDSDSASMQAVM